MRVPSPVVRPSFTDPRFALLVAGETVNSVGGWASAIVLWGFAAYRFNASPYAVSVTIVCWAAPPALLSPLLGVYIDRIGPKAAVIAGYCAAAGAALGMAAAGSLDELAVAAACYGCARALAGPAASALPPRIVADDDLLAANALLGAAASAGQVAGSLTASAALALSGFPAAFIVDAASYLIGAAVVAPLPVRPAPKAPPRAEPGTASASQAEPRTASTPHAEGGSRPGTAPAPSAGRRAWHRELAEGLGLAARLPAVRLIVLLSAAVTFTSAAYLVVEPLYARHVLHRPPSQFALFEAAAGIGAILAGLAVSRIRSRSRSRSRSRIGKTARPPLLLARAGAAASAAAIGYGLAACLFTGTTSLPAAYAGAFAWGVAGSVFGAVALTALQQAAPVTAHGRVMSVAATLQAWVETAGLPLGGLTLAALGVRPGALALAAVTIAAGLLGLALLASSRRKPPATPKTPKTPKTPPIPKALKAP